MSKNCCKYTKTTSNKCPVCGVDSPGNTCGHLYHITDAGIYLWFIPPPPAKKKDPPIYFSYWN
jgi:hypothetical protein